MVECGMGLISMMVYVAWQTAECGMGLISMMVYVACHNGRMWNGFD